MDTKFFLGVWDAADDGVIIQVLGANSIIHRQLLTSSGVEYATGAGNMGSDGKYIGERRSR